MDRAGLDSNYVWRFSSYLAENALRIYYKDQAVDTVYGNNCCLLSELYETHKYTVFANVNLLGPSGNFTYH
jgi:hypothetical protein